MSLLSTMLETYKGNNLNREKLNKLQQKRLRKLVLYAKENSSYFNSLYKEVDNNFNLEDLPATNKIELMKSFDEWVTDNNITKERVDSFTKDIENVGKMLDDKYLIFKTSGSTGNPVTVLYDKKNIDVASSVAALRTFARKEDLRNFLKHGKKTAGVFANYGFYLACGMSRYLQLKMPNKHTKITIDINSSDKEIIKKLNGYMPSMLSGYPSNLAILSEYEELKIKPDIVITGGELLTDKIRNKLENKFNCYVQTHYSCTEAGEIACECEEKHLHINEDWVIVEPVDKFNNPVSYGVCSDKVLITNLSNYIQPFIRYEITDRIIVHNEKCKCGKKSLWLEIEGRTDEILEFENNVLIAPLSFYKVLEEIDDIIKFQLIQKSYQKLELRLISNNKVKVFNEAKQELIELLRSKNVFDVEIYLSDELPSANKTSGKYKHVYKDF